MLKNLKIQPITQSQISSQEVPLKDLWMLKFQDQSTGPFTTHQLREAIESDPEQFNELLATNLIQNNYTNFFSHLQFQRREPKLVQASSLVIESHFHFLDNGQKRGPISLEELEAKIKNSELALNNQISTDGGQSWIKVYEHHYFDRRNRKANDELPFVPNNEVLHKAIEVGQEAIFKDAIQNESRTNEEQDALVGLALATLGNMESNVSQFAKKQQKSSTSFMAWSVSLIIVLGFGFVFLNQDKEDTFVKVESSSTAPVAINNSSRSISKKIIRKPASVKPQYKRPTVEPRRSFNKPKVQRAVVKRQPRVVKKAIKKAPRRITHFADDFNSPDEEDLGRNEDQDDPRDIDLDRDLASADEEDIEDEERLTQEEIEAIELNSQDESPEDYE